MKAWTSRANTKAVPTRRPTRAETPCSVAPVVAAVAFIPTCWPAPHAQSPCLRRRSNGSSTCQPRSRPTSPTAASSATASLRAAARRSERYAQRQRIAPGSCHRKVDVRRKSTAIRSPDDARRCRPSQRRDRYVAQGYGHSFGAGSTTASSARLGSRREFALTTRRSANKLTRVVALHEPKGRVTSRAIRVRPGKVRKTHDPDVGAGTAQR